MVVLVLPKVCHKLDKVIVCASLLYSRGDFQHVETRAIYELRYLVLMVSPFVD